MGRCAARRTFEDPGGVFVQSCEAIARRFVEPRRHDDVEQLALERVRAATNLDAVFKAVTAEPVGIVRWPDRRPRSDMNLLALRNERVPCERLVFSPQINIPPRPSRVSTTCNPAPSPGGHTSFS
jgi:hypothetical protein